jgi:hypothetical protein
MTALVKDTACSQLAIHKRDSQLTTEANRHKTSLSKRWRLWLIRVQVH